MLKKGCFCFIVFSLISFFSFSQTFNRLNKKGERTGKWIVYSDSARKNKLFEGRFRNGLAVGKSYYYTNDGTLDRKEIIRRKKIKTTFYHSNGKARLKGLARIDNLPDKIHYYYYGRWEAFNEHGTLEKYLYYEKGNFIKSVYLDKNVKLNDSLVFVLNRLDKEFVEINKNLVDSINQYEGNTVKQKSFKSELRRFDSLCYLKIDTILARHGYPSKQIVGDEVVGIPFFILGFAPLSLKEKHYQTILMAVSKGDVEATSFAYFADKIKVAKGEKQIYGTQYYVDKEYNIIYYPIEDKEHLDERRKTMGLGSFEESEE